MAGDTDVQSAATTNHAAAPIHLFLHTFAPQLLAVPRIGSRRGQGSGEHQNLATTGNEHHDPRAGGHDRGGVDHDGRSLVRLSVAETSENFGNTAGIAGIGGAPSAPPSGSVPPIESSSSTGEDTTAVMIPTPITPESTTTATAATTVEGSAARTALTNPNAHGPAAGLANLFTLKGIPSATSGAEKPTAMDTGLVSGSSKAGLAERPRRHGCHERVASQHLQYLGRSSASGADGAATHSVPDRVLALPGTIISTALSRIAQALAPLIGPGAPVDNPMLWGLLAFVRRQFDQNFANSTPVLAPRQTSQDLDDAQVHGTFGGSDADGDTLTYSVPTTGLGAPVHGTVTIDQTAGTYTYTTARGTSEMTTSSSPPTIPPPVRTSTLRDRRTWPPPGST